MENFDEIVNDIVFAIDLLEFKSLEENLLKVDLLMNINRLLISEKEYKKNINLLSHNMIVKGDDKEEDDKIFDNVSTSIINAIANLKYNDKDKLVVQSELLLNIYMFLRSKKEYNHNIRVLNDDLNKERRFSLSR